LAGFFVLRRRGRWVHDLEDARRNAGGVRGPADIPDGPALAVEDPRDDRAEIHFHGASFVPLGRTTQIFARGCSVPARVSWEGGVGGQPSTNPAAQLPDQTGRQISRVEVILMPTGWSWPSSLHAALARRARAPGKRFRGRLARAEHGKILSANADFNDPHGVNPEEGSWPHGKSRAC